MASKLTAPSSSSLLHPIPHFHLAKKPISSWVLWSPGSRVVAWSSSGRTTTRHLTVRACAVKEKAGSGSGVVEEDGGGGRWGKVSAVLFDMDGVLCNSEEPSRMAAVDLFEEMGVRVAVNDFVPFTGMGEANFLGGVAKAKGVKDFSTDAAKKRFFEIYLDKYAKPGAGIGFPGALELITQCKNKGLKVAVASSADRIKVDANLAAAGLPISMFDAVVSADAFENLKPAPDIFLAASKLLNVQTSECLVIEDALAGVQAANAAQMRCIAVTTTMSEEALKNAGPSFIRSNIGNITLDDILYGEARGDNEKMQESQAIRSSTKNLETIVEEKAANGSILKNSESKGDAFSIREFQGYRRDVIRYGSLGVALSCLYFTISNWKAMQYASPKALWNMLVGVNQPSFERNGDTGKNNSSRVSQFVKYISELETRGTATTVPEFPAKLDWLNTAPLQFRRDLKGKVVLLDFWTYCCINCMHVLPDLDFLEKKYKDMPFTVVGVHSAKFDNEKDLEAIRSAVLRYNISHPVVNDGDMYLWHELGINSWPTFAIVGPNGKLIAQVSGEGRRKDLDDLVEAALVYYGGRKMLDAAPIPLNLERNNDPRLLTSPLKFPGKLAVDSLNNRLFISDSNHNRIVVTDLTGNFIVQIGSTGEEGLRDGSFDDASFNRPQGLAYNAKKNVLYVADTENHALREIDFVNETVQTLAGNGTKGSDYEGGRKGTTQLLNSPWDVCFEPVNEKLYIAMAGQHQIWTHDTVDGTTIAFSGDGYERNLNGSGPKNTSFAQPSGISLSPGSASSPGTPLKFLMNTVVPQLSFDFRFVDMKELYVADSESSSVRALDLKTGGSRLLGGGDPVFPDNLFKFGDHDGVGSEVLLQHPLGVLCARDGKVYIADSYNHKIKRLDPATKRVTTVAGTGKAGFKDGTALSAQLSEPAGIIEAENGKLIIADTNNSVIRFLDLNNNVPELLTLELKGVQQPVPKTKSVRRLRRRPSADTQTVKVDGVPSKEGNLLLKISLPGEYHFSKEARSKFSIETEPENALVIEPSDGYLGPDGSAVLRFSRSSASASIGRVSCKVYYCKEDEVCLYQSLVFEVPFQEVLDSSPSQVTLSYLVKPRASTSSLQLPVPS